ncbi:TetR/AcrR family transcriptional regulator [Nocardioides sp. KIGAM211]|uniref:TetR/AcrR family transcriptional regulator n=1 Tax=Nocardioides luti TaxID=2761101 RepID=A0A7X0REQ5_9ACTN|nr:TetR/AcrR family transcriptional regulator [Nocardioides luti]MBB6626943.1 TetR/AcrR family transcriptional regulator [Nocardioides luti]
MARYAPDHKDQTRQRMVETSARRFKRDGFDGSGIATLVADAGLTNGAFYGHFASKHDLIATVVAEQLAAQVARVETLPLGLASVEVVVDEYLSPGHRDDPGEGCPSAALLDEITRQEPAARQAYTDGARALIDAIARHLAADDVPQARDRAIGLYSLLIASLQLARAVTDLDLSDQVLASARDNAMRIVTGPAPTSGTPSSSRAAS